MSKIPHDQMVDGSTADELLSLSHEGVGEGLGVLDNLLGVSLELWSVDFLQLNSECGNRNIMRSSLEHWEHSEVDGIGVLNSVENDT